MLLVIWHRCLGIDPGIGPGDPHYRCLFADGTARVASEVLLCDPGLRPRDAEIKGSSFFFVGAEGDRLVPNAALAALYDDAATPRHTSDTAGHSVQWMHAWRALGRTTGSPARR